MRKKGLLCLLMVIAMAFSACAGEKTETAVTVNGEAVTEAEYALYLYTMTQNFVQIGGDDVWNMDFDGQTAQELVDERTMAMLEMVYAAKTYANEHNITLTDEQKAEVQTTVDSFLNSVSSEDISKIGASDDIVTKCFTDSYLYGIVYDTLVNECEIDPTEVTAYFEENKEALREESTYIEMESVVVDTQAAADEVAQAAKNGKDMFDLFEEYDIDENAKGQENGNMMALYAPQYVSVFGQAIPENDEIVGPIAVDDVFYILHVTNITVPSDVDVEAIAQTKISSEKQAEYADATIAEVSESLTIERNEEVIAGIESFR